MWRVFLFKQRFGGLLPLAIAFLPIGFRETFARFDGRRVLGDVADDAALLRLAHQRFVDEFGQTAASEIGEGTRKSTLTGNCLGAEPAA